MSFIDDFLVIGDNDPLRGLFKKKTTNVWEDIANLSMSGLSATGVKNSEGGPLPKYQSNRKASSEEIAAVIQNRTRAFDIIDINPYLLTRDNYANIPPLSTIAAKVGYESENDASASTNPLYDTGWRTVQLPILGTFLKIEFLPSQINIPNPLNSADVNQYQKPDYTEVKSIAPGNRVYSVPYMSNRTVLLQFDDPQAPLFLAKEGDIFKVPFSTVYVTCKTYVPRFQVIYGFNAEVASPSDNRVMNSQPAFGPGHGLWENPHRHCSPFCFTNQDQNPDKNYSSVGLWSLNPNTEQSFTMFDLTNSSPLAIGNATGWITSISLCVGTVDGTNNGSCFGDLYVYCLDNIGTARKLLCSIPYIIAGQYDTQSHNNFFTSKTFAQPIRFSLQNHLPVGSATNSFMPKLILACTNGSTATLPAFVKWSIEGYVYGSINRSGRTSTTGGGQYLLELQTTNPFPLDQRWPNQLI